MKWQTFIIIVALFSSSCNQVNQILNRNPHLELSKYAPYDLEVTDFSWSYGMTEINKLEGDFELLDHRVYNFFKGKSGLCKLYFKTRQSNQYGNESLSNKYVGEINIDELNKYHDWEYWHKSAGINVLIYKNIVNASDNTKIDTAAMNTTTSTEHLDSKLLENKNSKVVSEVYGFGEEDLYPLMDDRAPLDSTRYVLDGTIDQVDLDTGIIHLIADGNFYTVLFNPKSPSLNVRNRLAHALKKSNLFQSVCAPNGENTLQLVTVQITEK